MLLKEKKYKTVMEDGNCDAYRKTAFRETYIRKGTRKL